MLLGTVFLAELRIVTRRRRDFFVRSVLAGLLLLLVATQYLGWRNQIGAPTQAQFATFARQLYSTVTASLALAIMALTPALVAGTITESRARHTLDALLCTQLSSLEILVGKFGARMVRTASFLAIGLPIECLLAGLSGISGWTILSTFAGIASLAFFLGSLSLIVSVASRSSAEAVFIAYVILAGWLTITLCIGGPIQTGWPQLDMVLEPATQVLLLVNPLTLGGQSAQSWFRISCLMVVSGTLVLLLASHRLRSQLRPALPALSHRSRWRNRRSRPDWIEEPMVWKEMYVSRNSGLIARTTRMGVGLILLVLASETGRQFVTILTQIQGGFSARAERVAFNDFLRTVSCVAILAGIAGVTAFAAGSITSERESDTWSSLLSSPIEGPEVLAAKRAGARAKVRPVWLVLIILWSIGLLSGAIHSLGWLVALGVTWVAFRFAAALGTFISLHVSSSTRALVIAFLCIAICQGGYLLCCVPLPGLSAVIFLGCTPAIADLGLSLPEEMLDPVPVRPSLILLRRNLFSQFLIVASLNLVVYGVGTLLLNILGEIQFDRVNDRPIRSARESDR